MSEEIDLEALEKHVQESLNDTESEETEEVAEEASGEEIEEETEEAFDLDEALNSDNPIALEGRITEEQAKEEASKRGWKEEGQDRYGHKISAIEFLERAPLFNKINLMRGDIDALTKKTQTLAEQSKMIAQKSVEDKKKLNEELKAAKDKLLSAEYLDTEDVAKLKTLDKQIEDTTVVETAEVPELSDQDKRMADDYDAAKVEFVKNNDWYENDYKMTKMADEVGVAYVNNYLEAHKVLPPPEETFNHVISEVKKAFPSVEKKTRQTRVASTQNRTVVSQIKTKKTLQDIPEEARDWAKEVMESANISVEEYLKTYNP